MKSIAGKLRWPFSQPFGALRMPPPSRPRLEARAPCSGRGGAAHQEVVSRSHSHDDHKGVVARSPHDLVVNEGIHCGEQPILGEVELGGAVHEERSAQRLLVVVQAVARPEQYAYIVHGRLPEHAPVPEEVLVQLSQ